MANHKNKWTADQIPSQAGRRVLITGASSGIGFETALQLARKGAEVILPARTLAKAQRAATRLAQEARHAQIAPAELNLESQRSVRTFAKWFERRYPGPSLDLLINNAGVMAIPKREITEDGFERQIATNFLGPFALTALVYPHLKQQAGTRVVFVSSSITKWAKLDLDNLQSERRYSPLNQAYAQSKLADSIFALELQRRVRDVGSPVKVIAAHPGYALTNLQTSGPGTGWSGFRVVSTLLKPFTAQTAEQGALPALFASVADSVDAGGYYGPDGFLETKGFPVAVTIPKRAKDPKAGADLWERAEQLTGLRFELNEHAALAIRDVR